MPLGLHTWRALALALGLALGAAAPEPAQGLPWFGDGRSGSLIDSWQTEQGLPQNHVTSILQTRDGYLWIGTYEGLARFDGVRFVVFHAASEAGLPSSRITSLHQDAAGALWIGHEHGQVTRYRGGQFETARGVATAPRGSVIGLQSDDRGDVWLLRRNGVAERMRDSRVLAAAESTALPVLFVHRGERGTNANGLWRVQAGRLARWSEEAAGLTGEPERPTALFPRTNDFVMNACSARDGALWVISGRRLWKWIPGQAEVDGGPVPWGDSPVARLLEARTGILWVGTQEQGLYARLPSGDYWHFDRTNGLPSDWVRTLAEDREGTLWVGTGGGGLSALRARRVQMLSPSDGWQGRGLLSVAEGSADDLWVGTEGAGLYQFVGTQVRRHSLPEGLANAYVWSVLDDGRGDVWAGTWGKGLFRRAGDDGWQAVPGLDQEGLVVTALYRSRSPGAAAAGGGAGRGPLWVGTHQGLVRYDPAAGAQWIGRELRSPEVRTIVEGEDGAIWFGMSGGGLGRWQNGEVRQYGVRDGLPAADVWSLWPDRAGGLWIGTVGGGLCRWKDGRFVTIDGRHGLPNDVVCQIVDDGRGALWLGTRGGIARVAQADLAACADGRLAAPAFFTYGRSDGLATLECSGGAQPSGGLMRDGKLVFPTTKGLAVIDPQRFATNRVAPPVLMESLSIAGAVGWQAGTNAAPVRVPPGRQRFEFRFTALSFIAPERVRFRYKLDGWDESWTESTGLRTVGYSRVPPGDYIFRVTACNSDGVWNADGAILRVTVLPQVWQTWWFRVAAVLLSVVAIGGVARRVTRERYRRKLEQVERQRAVERERARIARDIHDDLGASLTRITLLSHSASEDLADPELTSTHLHRIGAISRELTKALEEIVWAINPRHDTLDSLATYLGKFAQDLSMAAGLRCRIDIPTQLPPWPLTAELRHNLFLAFKEALHNVVRHAAARQVNVALQLGPESFALAVEDDGVGFDLAGAPLAATAGGFPGSGGSSGPGSSPATSPGGNGLQNMARRLEEIGGRCEIGRRPDGPGTIVRFVVKIHDNPSAGGSSRVMK